MCAVTDTVTNHQIHISNAQNTPHTSTATAAMTTNTSMLIKDSTQFETGNETAMP